MAIDSNALLDHFRRHRRWTRDLVGVAPEELFDWIPEGAGFSCGGLVRHLMQAEVFWRRLMQAAVANEPYDPFGIEGTLEERVETFRRPNVGASRQERMGTSFARCLETWTVIQAATEEAISSLSPTDLEDIRTTHPLTGLEGPLWELLIVMMEHEAHHRGQLSAYFKMRGVEHPPTLWS